MSALPKLMDEREAAMSKCERFGKWIAGCKFEPRYDMGMEQLGTWGSVKIYDAETAKSLRAQTYVRDVCVRCGKTIERDGEH